MSEDSKIRINSESPDSITISGLSKGERDLIKSALNGSNWVRKGEGSKDRLLTAPAFKAFPDPINDEEMMPFWDAPGDAEKQKPGQLKLLTFDELDEFSDPAIIISHLCGYNWSAENYKLQARKLKSYGFDIMRSQRGADGKFWEKWYLPGLWSAKGDLKNVIDNTDRGRRFDAAIGFLNNIQFGSLDVCVQRLAMSHPD